jgi:uncharacterized protein
MGHMAFMNPEMLAEGDKQQLLEIARNSIQHGLHNNKNLHLSAPDFPESLQQIRATFVTLKINSVLRGCIGTTNAILPLVESVSENAFAAAFRDPRFAPLTSQEFGHIHVSIAILTPCECIEFNSEQKLLEQIRPGIDGLIIEKQNRRATFLPAVWESLPVAKEFLTQLKVKADINPELLPDRAWRYQSYSFSE